MDGKYQIYVRNRHNEWPISGAYDEIEFLGEEGNLLKFKVKRNGNTLIKKITLSGYGRFKRAQNEEKVLEELDRITKLVKNIGKVAISYSEYLDDILEKNGELTVYEFGNREYLINKRKDKYRIIMRIGNKEKELTKYYDKIVFDKKYGRVLIFEVYDEKTEAIITKKITLPKEVPISTEYDHSALELCHFLGLPKNEKGYQRALRTKEMWINGKGLRYIPKSIGRLKNLEELYLGGNQISEIPIEIEELKNLKVLYLSENKIRKIPNEIGELKNLEELDLSNNPLTKKAKKFLEELKKKGVNVVY